MLGDVGLLGAGGAHLLGAGGLALSLLHLPAEKNGQTDSIRIELIQTDRQADVLQGSLGGDVLGLGDGLLLLDILQAGTDNSTLDLHGLADPTGYGCDSLLYMRQATNQSNPLHSLSLNGTIVSELLVQPSPSLGPHQLSRLLSVIQQSLGLGGRQQHGLSNHKVTRD